LLLSARKLLSNVTDPAQPNARAETRARLKQMIEVIVLAVLHNTGACVPSATATRGQDSDLATSYLVVRHAWAGVTASDTALARTRDGPRAIAPSNRVIPRSSLRVAGVVMHEQFKSFASVRPIPERVVEHDEIGRQKAGTNQGPAVMTIARTLNGGPYDQRAGRTRQALRRIGTPNDKMHPAFVHCQTIIVERQAKPSSGTEDEHECG
jgi:hypothetical protein